MTDPSQDVEHDYTNYKVLLDLWSKENPIKTTKLQVLLAVNGLLASAVNISGGISAGRWYIYLAAAVFCLIWMFSIGRTVLFQDVWQRKLQELHERYPKDSRFAILQTKEYQARVSLLARAFGAVPSKWYLLFSPLVFALSWLVVLLISLRAL
jgi:hypothetical protein